MKIITSEQTKNVKKPEGTDTTYYLRDEYEIHYNKQAPKTTQTWHRHKKILETVFIIQGEMTAEWKEGKKVKKQIVCEGDLIETEKSFHTFINNTKNPVKYMVFKQILSGKNKRDIFKNDKILK